MTVADTKPIVWVGIGLFVGTLLTLVISIAITRSDSGSDFQKRMLWSRRSPCSA